MTTSERLWSAGADALEHLRTLSLAQILVNAGMCLLVIAGAWAAATAGNWALRRALHQASRFERRNRPSKLSGVGRWARAFLRLLCGAIAIWLCALVWGFDIAAWVSAGVGESVVALVLRLCLIGLLAGAAFQVTGLLIGHSLGRLAGRSVETRRQAQLRTLAPLLTGLARTIILVMFGLMALGDLGVKVGPLLAGAGVVGVALGFGAQTIVKDFLTGVFLVVEDIISVGDVVRIGDSGGLVERMTLRTIRLRDFDGALHVFPYGEAQVVHNLTKTFSYYAFDLQVSYGADLDHAMEVIAAVGAGMQADPQYRDLILEPIEVAGVDNLAENGVVLKARIKTLPIKQWMVGREFNRRIKLAFDREGIEIPYPHMKLVMPSAAAKSA